jgi:hypothetical protein
VFGGPVYFFRNLLYNVPTGVAFKFTSKPAGLFVYHNTIIGEHTTRQSYSNVHYRNNLFLGRDTADRGIMTWANATSVYSSDYNAFRPNKGVRAQYSWLAPAPGRAAYEPQETDWKTYATLDELRKATGQEAHGFEVDYDVFERMAPPDPLRPHAVYHAMDLDFRLRSRGKAVDAGVRLPTINDEFSGQAPDLGALELGGPRAKYGPRWLTWAPFYR